MSTHFLMFEDEPDAQEFFRQLFRQEIGRGEVGFDVAVSGEDAVKVLAVRYPLTMLSDINIPGMSGIDRLAELRDTRPGPPLANLRGDAA